MKRFGVSVAVVLFVLSVANAASAATTIYTDESSFLGAIDAGYYLENFDSYSYGSYTGSSLDMGPVNGFSYTISASNQLYSGPGNMSTNTATDSLVITFTGSSVTAVGGIFWPTNVNGYNLIGDVTVTLSDGTVLNLIDAGFSTFSGFVTDGAAITSLSIVATESSQWPTVDHLYVGQGQAGTSAAVPVPGALGLVVFGAGLVGRMRRRTA